MDKEVVLLAECEGTCPSEQGEASMMKKCLKTTEKEAAEEKPSSLIKMLTKALKRKLNKIIKEPRKRKDLIALTKPAERRHDSCQPPPRTWRALSIWPPTSTDPLAEENGRRGSAATTKSCHESSAEELHRKKMAEEGKENRRMIPWLSPRQRC
ncbi:hypothetical protein Droror1_Dr00018860 [Drosera rotundifolia]